MTVYYAVTDAGGPISVRLDAQTDAAALEALDALLAGDRREPIDEVRTDIEEDLDIELDDPDSADATDRLVSILLGRGARVVGDRTPYPGVPWTVYSIIG